MTSPLAATQPGLPYSRLAILARCLPFALYIALLAFEGSLAAMLPALDPRWLYALRIAVVLAALMCFRKHYTELDESASATHWLMAAVLGSAVFLLWIALDSGWVTLGSAAAGFVPLAADGSRLWQLIVVRIFGASIVVPIMEELFWRSFVQRWIDNANFLKLSAQAGSWRALLITSLAFGFEHNQWLAGILAGLAYGWLYRRSGRLWPAIAAHALTNLLLGVWVVASGAWYFW